MSLTYAPDVAPELEPGVVHWQPAHKTPAQRETEMRIVVSAGAVAVLALAAGLVAFALVVAERLNAGPAPSPRRFGARPPVRLRRAF